MKTNSAPLNPWAFVAIVCSIGMCPFFTIAGVLLGVRALVDIKARPGTRGVRLAWSAIFIGSLVTGLWGGGMLWWNFNVRGQMQHGLVDSILNGQENDKDFVVHFTNQNQKEAEVFLLTLKERYGMLESGEQIESHYAEGGELAFYLMPLEAVLKYDLRFSNASKIDAAARFVLFDVSNETRQFTNKFAWICIYDEDRGNLVYPSDAKIDSNNE
jgi:hypothetical protein